LHNKNNLVSISAFSPTGLHVQSWFHCKRIQITMKFTPSRRKTCANLHVIFSSCMALNDIGNWSKIWIAKPLNFDILKYQNKFSVTILIFGTFFKWSKTQFFGSVPTFHFGCPCVVLVIVGT
jgi:hypothetical protein